MSLLINLQSEAEQGSKA